MTAAPGSAADPLERTWRRLLVAYPPAYRRERGEELVATLMEATGERRWPPAREVLHLVGGGLAARVREAGGRTAWWADGLHVGVLAVAASTYAGKVHVLPHLVRPVWTALAVLLVLAIMRGWVRLALPLAAAAALQAHGVGDFGPWSEHPAPYWVVVAGLAVLAVRPGRMPSRSWLWALVPIGCWALQYVNFGYREEILWLLFWAGVEVTALAAALLATVAVRDGRWALAAAVYVAPGLVYLAANLPDHGRKGLVYWALLTLLVLASAVTARRARRLR
ncbi:hypothetical protein [Nonomuraea sp. C10]|uniref:hypothetical protein n=1 Tax=Nonomuraea sp. C10 TaxID=2600577 RepID=UPI0011CEA002|nr:hypothetical protein [Nonomuraea sp. C10]TXK34178.1 hypothetical protein FR742_32805 [Nonomuraea sp. C10]